jgi:hypothetical protein
MTLRISDIQHNDIVCYADCRYAEGGIYLLLYCHYAECCYDECRYAESFNRTESWQSLLPNPQYQLNQ